MADMTPEASANFWNSLTFSWFSPLLALGAQRHLQAGDLWKMQPEHEAQYLAERLTAIFQQKWDEAKAYNVKLVAGEIIAPWQQRLKWSIGLGGRGTVKEKEAMWRAKAGKNPSLFWTLLQLFGTDYFIGTVYKASTSCQVGQQRFFEADALDMTARF